MDFTAPERQAWKNMKRRVRGDSPRHRVNYTARGITICDRWDSFDNFLSDMGLRPSPEHTLDRIDNDGNYEPSNCRWATRSQQARNRRTNVVLTVSGERKTLVEWAEIVGLDQRTLKRRLDRGWCAYEALSTPVLANPARRARHLSHDRATRTSTRRLAPGLTPSTDTGRP